MGESTSEHRMFAYSSIEDLAVELDFVDDPVYESEDTFVSSVRMAVTEAIPE